MIGYICYLIFTAIGNAYAILSDSSKRKQYDVYGEEDVHRPSSNRNGHHRHSHSFEADISPEDLFNMFFSGSAFTCKYCLLLYLPVSTVYCFIYL